MNKSSKNNQKPRKIETVKRGGVSKLPKEDLICNQLVVFEIFLEKMINREYINEETKGKTQQVVFETVLMPMLKKIRQSGEKMESGLYIRQRIMTANNLENYYQKEKPALQEAFKSEFVK